MAYRWTNTLTEADVTPKELWMNRRAVLAALGATGAAGIGGRLSAQEMPEPNTLEDIRSYCNFYEFGTGKSDPAQYAPAMDTSGWQVTVDGLVDNPGTYALEDLIGDMTTESRVYRFRCVEAWSMVIPWNGFELADLLNKVGVQEGARYVAFETAVIPEVMPGVRSRVLDFPYVEGLRLDEAMHPLTLMATGIYNEPMANQNGAPMRLVVPWKYGFKSIKSIVRISLVADEPPTSWNKANAREYGFYSNVNPNVNHPRWSQASERVIGAGLFGGRQDTLMFNGYEEEVASLSAGQDLAKDY